MIFVNDRGVVLNQSRVSQVSFEVAVSREIVFSPEVVLASIM